MSEIISLMPDFKLGLWNAWIFMLPPLLIWLSFIVLNKGKRGQPSLSRKEKRLLRGVQMTIFAPFVYSAFLPLKLGTAWFYAGSNICLLGMTFAGIAVLDFTTTSADKPVTKGVHHISRNPMFFGWFLILIGIGIACTSWIYLLLAIASITLMDILVISEERFLLEKYRDAYREYMNRTPKWIGIPKSRKK